MFSNVGEHERFRLVEISKGLWILDLGISWWFCGFRGFLGFSWQDWGSEPELVAEPFVYICKPRRH